MTVTTERKKEIFIFAVALIIGCISQYGALINEYVVANDVHQFIYWLEQLRDSVLFQNDIMTDYVKGIQPWGFTAFYFIFLPIVDPLILCKILPIILLGVASVYFFKIAKFITDDDVTGFLAAFLFMTSRTFPYSMVGGLPRAFGMPLLIIFIYYFLKRDYVKISFIMLLQTLFYPMIFLISLFTYAFSFLALQKRKVIFDFNKRKIVAFVLVLLIGMTILKVRYYFFNDPQIGSIATYEQIVDNPAFYEGGRDPLMPTQPMLTSMKFHFVNSFVGYERIRTPLKKINHPQLRIIAAKFAGASVVLLFFFFIVRRRMSRLAGLLYLVGASLFLYKIADLVVMTIHFPDRYAQFPMRIVGPIIAAIFVGQIILMVKPINLKRILGLGIIIFILFCFHYDTYSGLDDFSQYKHLYSFVKGLEPTALIAAHPNLADGIPTFSQRKVFVKYELSYPFYDHYWETISKRTQDFFDAYYAEDRKEIYQFLEEYKIDYLIVSLNHFSREYLNKKAFYFEPFNARIVENLQNRKQFALTTISNRNKIFNEDGIFIIKREYLLR